MKFLIVQNVFEDGPGRWIALHVPIKREPGGRIFFGNVQKGEHGVVRLLIHAQVIEPMPGGPAPIE